jgi:hypothetical protein
MGLNLQSLKKSKTTSFPRFYLMHNDYERACKIVVLQITFLSGLKAMGEIRTLFAAEVHISLQLRAK